MNSKDMQNTVKAAELANQILRKVVVVDQGIHAESIIAAAGRMAGTMLYRSFGLDEQGLSPGSTVLSEQANQKGPALVDALLEVLKQYGHGGISAESMATASTKAAPPRFSLAENQTKLEPWYRKIMQTTDLSFQDMALASTIAAATVVHDCAEVLDVHAGTQIAVEGIVEGSKTVPQPYSEAAA